MIQKKRKKRDKKNTLILGYCNSYGCMHAWMGSLSTVYIGCEQLISYGHTSKLNSIQHYKFNFSNLSLLGNENRQSTINIYHNLMKISKGHCEQNMHAFAKFPRFLTLFNYYFVCSLITPSAVFPL